MADREARLAKLRALKDEGVVFADFAEVFGLRVDGNEFLERAKESLCDDELEIDDYTFTAEGEDGTWILAWVWQYHADSSAEGA